MRESYTIISVTFLALLMMMLILTYLLSGPIDDIYTSLLNIDFGADVNSKTAEYIPIYREATILVFALAVAMPFGWLVAKVFNKDTYDDPYDTRRF
jgi:hypothetical protein